MPGVIELQYQSQEHGLQVKTVYTRWERSNDGIPTTLMQVQIHMVARYIRYRTPWPDSHGDVHGDNQSSIRVDGTDDQTQLLWAAALCYIWS